MKRSALFCMAGLLPIIASYIGCSATPDAPQTVAPAKPAPLIPYTVGNQWMTKTTSFDQNGTMLSTEYDTSAVIEPVAIDGEAWYRIHGVRSRDLFAATRADGPWMRADLDSMPERRFLYPAAAGDTFGMHDGISYVMTSRDSVVSVPAGTFHCVVYHRQQHDASGALVRPEQMVVWRDYYWCVAPGIGVVKSGVLARSWQPGMKLGTYDVHTELTSYRVKL
jgi:hypothetical protein